MFMLLVEFIPFFENKVDGMVISFDVKRTNCIEILFWWEYWNTLNNSAHQRKRFLKMQLALVSTFLIVLHVQPFGTTADLPCPTTQYVELNEDGVVNCKFTEGDFGVFWYNSTEYTNTRPLIYFQNSGKGGRGYTSGEFDIYPNGSLIINNVTLQHDHVFTVVMFETSIDEPTPVFIKVVVFVKSPQLHPHIISCVNERICVRQVSETVDLVCRVRDSRPPAQLMWLIRTLQSDLNVTFETFVSEDSFTYSTTVKTSYNLLSQNRFTVLICVETNSRRILKKSESWIILEDSSQNIPNLSPIVKFVELGSKMELSCTDRHKLYLAWGKRNPDTSFSTLVHSLPGELWNVTLQSSYYHLDTNGSLIVDKVGFEDEGIFVCVYGNGTAEDQTEYNVRLYVVPIPAHPVVDGCSHVQYCVLNVEREGVLTCSLMGIRPLVDLQWSVIDERPNAISFSDKKTRITLNGGKFDIVSTSKFYINDAAQKRLAVACNVIGQGFESFDLSTQLDLVVLTDDVLTTPSERTSLLEGGFVWLGVIAVVLCAFVLVVVVGLLFYRKVCRETGDVEPRRHYRIEEEVPMVQYNRSDNISKKNVLKQELQLKYNTFCESFQPVPFLQNRVYRIDQLFVDGGFEFASLSSNQREVAPNLQSFRDVLKQFNGTKPIIIEGDPGYGKTMLSYRLAYDWYHQSNGDTDIFILLKMRNLGGVQSLPSAIKKFLLPYDSKLSEEDIEFIISTSSSIVIVLDGFDKYPDANNFSDTFVKLLLTKQILVNSTIILTTRPSSLPPVAPANTQKIRLTGFTKDAQKNYIQNVLSEGQILQRKRLEELFHVNEILAAICQVPLFFAFLVHITLAANQSEEHNYPTMTSFFLDVVKYFQCHLNEELDNTSHFGVQLFEKERIELEKMAFEGLSKNHRKIFWSREQFLRELGEDFYNHCLKVGIFFEEDIRDRNSATSPQGTYKFSSWVRFYHNTFCEWFAACHLARLAEELSSAELKEELKRVNPLNLPYLYRFSCGLSKTAAEKLIGYLESFKDGQKFAVLCILEQPNMSTEIISTIENLCKSPVNISRHDGILFHVSNLEFLKIASANKIPVKVVWLTNMESCVDDSKRLILHSGLVLENIDTLFQLSIVDVGRQFSDDDFLGILQYSTTCSQLTMLRFRACILPEHIESCAIPEELVQRKITVEWNPLQNNVWFKLNTTSGHWEHQREVLTKEQHSQIVCSLGGLSTEPSITYTETTSSSTITEELAEFLNVKPNEKREKIMEIVQKHCLSPINIHDIQPVKLQSTFVELLNFASECKDKDCDFGFHFEGHLCSDMLRHQHNSLKKLKKLNMIHIESVWLVGLNSVFDKSGLKFCSGVILPKLQTLRQLSIVDTGRTFSRMDFLGILQYSLMNPKLHNLRLRDCILPEKFKPLDIPLNRPDKKILVEWCFTSNMEYAYHLNFETGSWQLENEDMSGEKYQQIIADFQKLPHTTAA